MDLRSIFLFSLSVLLSAAAGIVSSDDWSLATAAPTSAPSPTGVGACGYAQESDYLRRRWAAVSGELFRSGAACGSCFEIRCVDHILLCLPGSPPAVVTASDFCAPNLGLPSDDGGWCNFPRNHFDLSLPAFAAIARPAARAIVPVQYRRARCERNGGMRFTLRGSRFFFQVLIENIGGEGEVAAVKVKGTIRAGWVEMGRNWGQIWQCSADLIGQDLSFEVTGSSGRRVTSYGLAPSSWKFGQTFEGKQFGRAD
ncbi:Expansin-A16 [Apostasia shenzhenica]|uniref:Expansin n=1 Tax=Apostasia shenzhenica TaxID=1088818 RepID=A0A2I0ALY3_9ASPA|nr:Expansin-A16 [Apostasia shenzhenica]